MAYDPSAPGRVADATEDDIIKEARERYLRATTAGAENRNRYLSAIRFVSGEQWDEATKRAREFNRRPCLTMDRLGTHINQIVNDQRQSKPAIKVHPVDDAADKDTAEIFNGVIRNIEHTSNAPMVYETAAWTQVAGGQGAWRVLTEYADENSFDQDLCLRRILDPTCVTWDPEAREQDASDGMFAFIETSYSKETFQRMYPDVDCDSWPTQIDNQGWWSGDTVRCAEYYRVVMRPGQLLQLANGVVMDSASYMEATAQYLAPEQVPPELRVVARRQVEKREVQWFKIGGHSVIDSRIWPGRWIPLVRVVGNEMVVDGKTVYTGLTHRAMDPQKVYNYQASVVVEMLSLQKTAPWIGAKGQFEGVEQRWAQANVNNPAYLEYNPVTVGDQIAPPPQRQAAAMVPTGNVQAMQLAADDLQWVTGQHSASFGAKSNETSGRAIMARQREGDSATYHYLDNLSRSILHTGRILVDLIPKVYDTRRVLRVLGEDGTAELVMQDPDQQAPMQRAQAQDGTVQRIYNLGVGRYDVAVAVGPSFGTRRQEAVEAMSTLLQGNPQLWQVVGDLFVRNQDWPGASEMAERLKKMVPPQYQGAIEGEEADPQAQVAQMQAAMQQAMQEMQMRDQALQEASQMVQQLQAAVQQKEQDIAAMRADVETKVTSEAIKAEAQKYVADKNAEIELLRTQQQAIQADRDSLSQQVADLATRLSQIEQEEAQEEAEGPDPETLLLQQLAQGQQQQAEVLTQLLSLASAPKQITIAKTPNGYQAISQPGAQ